MSGRLAVTTYYRTMSIDNKPTTVIIGPNGEPIKLPESLESLPKSDHFPTQRHRWNTNEEIASMLIAFDRHHEWLSKEVKIRPKSGSTLLYSRKKVRYRRDGYCWKKRKDGKTTREDHMKLKVQGMECIYGCYVHSAILPTFHRRCYWLLQNPDIVLVHYLNVPYPDDNKMVIANSITLWGDKKEWTKDELVSQLKPMFFSEEEPDLNNEVEISTAETVEAIVTQLMEKQRDARATALNKQMECSCPDSTCLDNKTCIHQVRKLQATKSEAHTTTSSRGRGRGVNHPRHHENNNQFYETDHRYYPQCSPYSQVSSTTGNNGLMLSGSHSPGSSTPGGQTPLVLSLSQSGGGLLILNSNSGVTTTSSQSLQVRQLSVCSPTPTPPSPRPPPPDRSSPPNASAGECGTVTAAVNTLNNIQEFSLDMNNGNYDSGYSGLQPITDSLLSGSEARKSDEAVKCEVKSENGPLLDFKSAFSDLDTKNDMSFFHETLDLSHDDIQRTLTANLPACSQQDKSPNQTPHTTTHRPHHHNSADLNMDYINNTNHHPAQSSSFDVNLEAFDNYILSDFPELGQYEGSTHSNGLMNNGHPGPMLSQAATNANNHLGTTIKTRTLEYRENLVSITDYSPGWAYTDAEEKILVTGPWYSQTKPYQILFDGVAVATTLVQSGVLRCFCPEHAAGSASLEVACEGTVISESVIFEYKVNKGKSKRPASKANYNKEHQDTKDKDLKNTLLNKLESLDICTVNAFMEDFNCQQEPFSDFEDHLVTMCQKLTSEDWTTEEGVMSDAEGESTLLHYAAALGYTRLVCSLLHWAAEHPGRRLGREVDALAKDSEGFTPLMRACANGKKEVATILYHWNSAASRIKNRAGETCADVAGKSSCPSFKLELEKLEVQKTKELRESEFCKPRPEFIKPIKKVTKKVIRAPSLEGYLNIPVTVRRSPSPLHIRSGSPGVRSLRGASPQIEATVGRKLKLIKRPSVDSGINLDSQAVKNTSKDIRQLSKNDRSLSLPASGFGKKEALLPILTSENEEKNSANNGDSEKNDENPGSPFIDVEGLSSDEEEQSIAPSTASKKEMDVEPCEDDQKVLTLAEHFLAAMPDKFKIEQSGDNEDDDTSILTDCSCSQHGPDCCSQSDDLGIESMADDLSVDFEFNFEEACQSYRDVSTPTSSHSPASFTMESPRSYNLESPSPCVSFSMDRRSPPTTAELQEFLQASVKCEKDLSNLTLSEREQRELYQAAQIIQKAYRSYKGRKKSGGRGRPPTDGQQPGADNGKEAKAAVVIQNYYRRYKQYIYWKQMSKAATLIQNKYRTYCEHKRFKKSQEAATCIQNYYRSYKELQNHSIERDESTPTAGLKRTYSQRRQHQAARKIQQFMKQTHLKLQSARGATRAASERLPTSGCPMACLPNCQVTPITMATPTTSITATPIICFPVGATTITINSSLPSRDRQTKDNEDVEDMEEEEDDHPEPKSCKKNYARN